MNEIVTIIPTLNESDNILNVIGLLKNNHLNNIIVGIDASTIDATSKILEKAGIPYVKSVHTGYDPTVKAAISQINKYFPQSRYILFADAGVKYDFTIVNTFLVKVNEGADLVLGSRLGQRENMLWHQKLGTQVVLFPIKILFKRKIEDISPFRLIRRDKYEKLKMRGAKFSFPSEMLIKCLALNYKVVEVPIVSLRRQGTSKVSGSFKNSISAGKDMFTSLQFAWFK
ncbi:MAG: hypothetical protein M3Q44_04600 [bacterium]|nr:hypothetical protein [bacterium]